MKPRIIAMLAAIAVLIAATARADSDVYPDISSIPAPLLQSLGHESQFEDRYVGSVVSTLRSLGRSHVSIDQEDIDMAERKRSREASKSRLRDAMRYDENFDQKVTPEEILSTLESERRKNDREDATRLDTRAKDILKKYDTNADSVITAKEAATPPESRSEADDLIYLGGRRGAKALLALDPDKNGTLTLAELEALAHKAFRTADKNRDGKLSEDEVKPVQEITRTKTLAGRGCIAPAVADKEKIVALSAVEGGAISNISVAGQNESTGVIRVNVERGAEPLYIVAASTHPVIWDVTGDASRISRFVVSGRLAREDGDTSVKAGVAGLPAAKVSFLKGKGGSACLPGHISIISGGAVSVFGERVHKFSSTLKEILGRGPDIAARANSPVAFRVDGASATASVIAESASSGTPAGLDGEVWKEALLLMPGGLATFKEADIVSDTKAEPYEVLPGWAGLAQMVYDGRLKPEETPERRTRIIVKDGASTMVVRGLRDTAVVKDTGSSILVTDERQFRIVKEIKAYPAGLSGGYAVRFMLPKGVAAPEVARGGSCVISEETGEPVGKNPVCQ